MTITRGMVWPLLVAWVGAVASCRGCERSGGDGIPAEPQTRDGGTLGLPGAPAASEPKRYPLAGSLSPNGLWGLTLGTPLDEFRRRFPGAKEEETGLWPFEIKPGIRAEALFLHDELALLLAHPCTGAEACKDTGRHRTDLEPACGGPPSIFPAPRGQLNQVEACVRDGRIVMRSAGPAAPVVIVDQAVLPAEVRALATLAGGSGLFGADVDAGAVKKRIPLGEGARMEVTSGPKGRGVCTLRLEVLPGQGLSRAGRVRKQLAIATAAFVRVGEAWNADVRVTADPAWRLTLIARGRAGCG